MSNDDELPPLDRKAIRQRLEYALKDEGSTWTQLLERTQLCNDDVSFAIGVYVEKPSVAWPVLAKVADFFGHDVHWLLTGRSRGTVCDFGQWSEMRRKIDEFTERNDLLPEDSNRLHVFAERKFRAAGSRTAQARYRRRLPQSVVEVAELYNEMIDFEN